MPLARLAAAPAALALFVALIGAEAHANTVNIYAENAGKSYADAYLLASVTSSSPGIVFQGFLYDASVSQDVSATRAVAFDLKNSGEDYQTKIAASFAETTLEFEFRENVQGSGEEYEFTVDTGYFALKLGKRTAFFMNLVAPATLSLTFDQLGKGAGLSHISLFEGLLPNQGNPSAVPIPGALVLMGTALAGAAGIGRWRKRQLSSSRT